MAVVLAQITWTHYVDDVPRAAHRQVAPELELFITGFFDLFAVSKTRPVSLFVSVRFQVVFTFCRRWPEEPWSRTHRQD